MGPSISFFSAADVDLLSVVRDYISDGRTELNPRERTGKKENGREREREGGRERGSERQRER